MTEPKDRRRCRAQGRARKMPYQMRNAVALEQIADMLEELRAQTLGIAHMTRPISTTLAKKVLGLGARR